MIRIKRTNIILYNSTYRAVKSIETKSRVVVARDWEKEWNGELVFKGDGVSVGEDENIMEMAAGKCI